MARKMVNMAQNADWRRKLQACFPEHQREHVFQDKERDGEIVADVFVEEKETVLMFQWEPLPLEEFIWVTFFHINHRRRIVWVFGEGAGAPQDMIEKGPVLRGHAVWYSVCICDAGDEQVVHRIVDDDKAFLTCSTHDIRIQEGMDIEDFFRDEAYWQNHQRGERVLS